MWIEKNGPTWRIRDLRAGKKVTIKAGYPTKTSAKAGLAIAKADRFRGVDLVPRGGQTTLRAWIERWWPLHEPSLRPTSMRTEGSRVRTHITPLLGDLRLDELEPMVLQEFVSTLAAGRPGRKPLAAKTIRNIHGVLHGILDAAVRERLIRANPASDSGLPRMERREPRFLTLPEIDQLLAACPDHWRPLVAFFLATGVRHGEALGLTVGRLDVLAGTATIEQALHHTAGGGMVLASPKTDYGRRTVTFPPETAGLFVPLVANRGRRELVFRSPDREWVTRTFRQRTWITICKAVGLDGLRLHDLRHTHAAILISAGVPLTAIQRRLGHSSIRVTSDMYGHLMPEVATGILAAVSAAMTVGLRGAVGESGAGQLRSTPVNSGQLRESAAA
jgi:integrase